MLAYLNLTKPRISLLFALTGLTALMMEKSVPASSEKFWLIGLAIFMVGGSANAFNQYLERDIDAQMARTAKKRPLPQGKMSPSMAAIFSTVLGLLGTAVLWRWGGVLSAALGCATILFYSFYYTLWLKPRTPYNIVIGGVAGSMGPVIAWAAATGGLSWIALCLFAIIFFWTPPHFWALALCCKNDYAKVSLPMLPIVAGEEATRRQILVYSFLLLPLSLTPFFWGGLGRLYLTVSLLLGVLFAVLALRLYRQRTLKAGWQLFGYSIVYLLTLFVVMILDAAWR